MTRFCKWIKWMVKFLTRGHYSNILFMGPLISLMKPNPKYTLPCWRFSTPQNKWCANRSWLHISHYFVIIFPFHNQFPFQLTYMPFSQGKNRQIPVPIWSPQDLHSDPFHTTPKKFENAGIFLRLSLPFTLIRHEIGDFWKRSSKLRNLKTPASLFSVDKRHFKNGTFRKR